ncbi:MAG TPA: succinyl-diaminopimelate desuccinylase [Aestuariivirgaceae bacterium]|nr:succinyl-diaminopimelate desuccinylase [Aestuariivirgaceae bacterium]
MTDPVRLLQDLIRCPSVTPRDAGCFDVVTQALAPLGFTAERVTFTEAGTADVDNLVIRHGSGGRHLGFAGHVDVVPPGPEASWSHPPFAGELSKGMVYGRGAADMKGAIAAFVAAAGDFVAGGAAAPGSISLILTADEEGPAVNGTAKAMAWLKERKAVPDHCLVGEPTSVKQVGDTIKIGRRGSLRATIVVTGRQGHSAYPHLADNPIPKLVRLLDRLGRHQLDDGNEHFEPSHLSISSIDVGNPAGNVIPERATAQLGIRFNTLHTPQSLGAWLQDEARCVEAEMGGSVSLATEVGALAFVSETGPFGALVEQAAAEVTGLKPALSTGGGTSDARFIRNYCPVVECGSLSTTIHQVDERIGVDELHTLTRIYRAVIERYFASP